MSRSGRSPDEDDQSEGHGTEISDTNSDAREDTPVGAGGADDRDAADPADAPEGYYTRL